MSLRSRTALAFSALALFVLGSTSFAQRITAPLAGTTVVQDQPSGDNSGIVTDEFNLANTPDSDGDDGDHGINRTIAKTQGQARSFKGGKKAKSNPEVLQSVNGLGFFDQRFANSGNQFSIEPPDQALCVGNGYVVEATNDVLRILTTGGATLVNRMDLNTFYGYPAAINRTTGARGQSITDPVCLFDADTNQFFMAVLTFDVQPTGSRAGTDTGKNHLDIAVTTNGDPTGSWRVYRVAAQNDGTDGTPDHGCGGLATPLPPSLSFITSPHACFGDYPHIGADAYGLYLTTNEFSLFGSGFFGSQLYALPKRALARGDASVGVSLINTLGYGPDGGGFTVWPAQAPAGGNSLDNGGTEFFMSSNAVFSSTGVSEQIVTWALTNTSSLETSSPNVNLLVSAVPALAYAVPGRASQKAGDIPLGTCITDSSILPGLGATCPALVGATRVPVANEGTLNANDSRMQQVMYANGKLWGAVDTGLLIDGDPTPRAGIAYYIINPQLSGNNMKGKVMQQGYIGLPFNNVGYPTIAALGNGRGVISYTLSGSDYYPTVGYSSLDPVYGAGDVHAAMVGAGPQDGFTEYGRVAFGSSNTRPRWGDYGAAAVDGSTIWFAQEYIGQTCNYTQYSAAANPFGTCGGTRASLGNWGTGIVQVSVQ
jgi:hypothetical protein